MEGLRRGRVGGCRGKVCQSPRDDYELSAPVGRGVPGPHGDGVEGIAEAGEQRGRSAGGHEEEMTGAGLAQGK